MQKEQKIKDIIKEHYEASLKKQSPPLASETWQEVEKQIGSKEVYELPKKRFFEPLNLAVRKLSFWFNKSPYIASSVAGVFVVSIGVLVALFVSFPNSADTNQVTGEVTSTVSSDSVSASVNDSVGGSNNTSYVFGGSPEELATATSAGGFQPSIQASPLGGGVSAKALGFAVGGSKDINLARESIALGYLPQPSDITSEGLFYDYYFDTSLSGACEALFCPSHSYVQTTDPLSGNTEHYLQVGLNSNLTTENFIRPKLNLVVVLDVSGSMQSPLGTFYYANGANGLSYEPLSDDDKKTKQALAQETLVAIVDKLNDDDRIGVISFSDSAKVVHRITSKADLRDKNFQIEDGGGTNLEAGIVLAQELFLDYQNDEDYQNRMIILTDAMPNLGATTSGSFLDLLSKSVSDKVYTTFVGVGLDFNSALPNALSSMEGANYVSINRSSDFRERLIEDFDLLVTPLVFDLKLSFDSDSFFVEKVYGVPGYDQTDLADLANGNLLNIATLFPSNTKDGETKGGVVLIKLGSTSDEGGGGTFTLTTSYVDRDENAEQSTQTVDVSDIAVDGFEGSGIRKAVLLANYIDLLQEWIVGVGAPNLDGYWEINGGELVLAGDFTDKFISFRKHFESEANLLADDTLLQELELIDNLLKFRYEVIPLEK